MTLDIDGVEIDSNNTTAEGRMLAERLARAKGVPGLIASDAHAVDVVGRYRQEFAEPLRTIRDLVDLLRRPSPAGAEQAPNGP